MLGITAVGLPKSSAREVSYSKSHMIAVENTASNVDASAKKPRWT